MQRKDMKFVCLSKYTKYEMVFKNVIWRSTKYKVQSFMCKKYKIKFICTKLIQVTNYLFFR